MDAETDADADRSKSTSNYSVLMKFFNAFVAVARHSFMRSQLSCKIIHALLKFKSFMLVSKVLILTKTHDLDLGGDKIVLILSMDLFFCHKLMRLRQPKTL